MNGERITRRRFLSGVAAAAAGTVLAACARGVVEESVVTDVPTAKAIIPSPTAEPAPTALPKANAAAPQGAPVVSIAPIENKDIPAAVVEAIDLLGGIDRVTAGKDRILLKPNLRDDKTWHIAPSPKVVETLARLMQEAGKEVLIGEGSMLAEGFNHSIVGGTIDTGVGIVRTEKPDVLDGLQRAVFDARGYTDLAESMGIPLVNLHTGKMTEVEVPGGFVFDRIKLNSELAGADLVCSIPNMKTGSLARVSLGMKNMMGAYPGSVYGVPLCMVHELATKLEPQGTAPAVVDIVRATQPGLVIVSGLVAQEGNQDWADDGYDLYRLWAGRSVVLNLIIAGKNPLATDMVAAKVMGFEPEEVPTFEWAWKAGMEPTSLDQIEIRGAGLDRVTRKLKRAQFVPYSYFRDLPWWCKEGELPKKAE